MTPRYKIYNRDDMTDFEWNVGDNMTIPLSKNFLDLLLAASFRQEFLNRDEEGSRIAKQFAGHTFNCQLSIFNCQLGQQFFVPKGFAHGFAVLSETAVFQYKCDEFYHPEADGGISILDDSLGIDWKIKDKAILSEKDTKHSLLKDFDSPFDIKIDLYI